MFKSEKNQILSMSSIKSFNNKTNTEHNRGIAFFRTLLFNPIQTSLNIFNNVLFKWSLFQNKFSEMGNHLAGKTAPAVAYANSNTIQ